MDVSLGLAMKQSSCYFSIFVVHSFDWNGSKIVPIFFLIIELFLYISTTAKNPINMYLFIHLIHLSSIKSPKSFKA